MNEEKRRIVYATLRWIRICHRTGYMAERNMIVPSNVDALHPSLLMRLLKGEEPFAEPPPISHGYPDTRTAEEIGMKRDPKLGST